MTKEEYVKKLKKIYRDNLNLAEDNSYGSGYCDALGEAIDLASTLDEPKKVVIPQFVDDWITRFKANFIDGPIYTAEFIADDINEGTDYHFDWLEDVDNQKLLLNAIANGYEVEEEKEYLVRIKGICQEGEWLNCEVWKGELYFEIDSRFETEVYKASFTKQWLKDNWPEYEVYNNAGLLEFEEVEDD
ncbi:DUF1642 domain-containing protein [Pediococcus pentosaceus]|uniref:DUF1642 domain-containing protein n=1 Tax=Pediococcus pentosaceus TaxID=1255 RepID=UPI003161008B